MPDGSLGAAVLRVEGVTKRFGGLVAVDNMSFELAKNEVLGLIGPNGSGKTTMLNMISGALKPTAGAILLDGKDISTCAGQRDRRPGRCPHVSDRSHAAVADGAGERHRRRRVRPQPALGRELDDYARDLLQRVGLRGADDASVAALTYIDQKRVELARALASDPEVAAARRVARRSKSRPSFGPALR